MAKERLYEVTVEGQYFAKVAGGGVALKYYSAKFVLPTLEAALSLIVKNLLAPKLRQTYPDFSDFRTHELTETRVLGDSPDEGVLKIPVARMSFEQLSDYCVLRKLQCDPYKHNGIVEARAAVEEALRLKSEADEAESRVAEENKERDSLQMLNGIDPRAESAVVKLGPGLAPIDVTKANPVVTKPADVDGMFNNPAFADGMDIGDLK